MNTDRPISALSCNLTSAIAPTHSGYALMLARFSVLVSLDHKIKIPKDYLADANIADCCIRITAWY
jgi:hypothetical protein